MWLFRRQIQFSTHFAMFPATFVHSFGHHGCAGAICRRAMQNLFDAMHPLYAHAFISLPFKWLNKRIRLHFVAIYFAFPPPLPRRQASHLERRKASGYTKCRFNPGGFGEIQLGVWMHFNWAHWDWAQWAHWKTHGWRQLQASPAISGGTPTRTKRTAIEMRKMCPDLEK